jgi:short-subunit dehydrogenase
MIRSRLSSAARFEGKKVLITGGSSGIGYHLAEDFLRMGARVFTVSEDGERLESSLASLRAISPNIQGAVCDIGDPAAVERMAKQVLAGFGCPDILINNAGSSTYRTFETTPSQELEHLASVNFVGPMRVTLAFVGAMKARGSGQIVIVSSIAGKIVFTPHSVYCAAKHGVSAWSEALYHELRPFGIAVTVAHPGRVSTEFFRHETFAQRPQRPESSLGVPVERVCADIIRGIDRKSFCVYSPFWLRFVAWAYLAFPLFSRPVFGYIIGQRIRGYYQYRRERAL